MLRLNRWIGILCIAGILGTALLAGCGSAPKPKELQELERILGEEGANEVKEAPGARKYYEDSRKLRRAALDEWEENNIGKARQYAILGKLNYRTAQEKAQQYEANEKLEEANAKIEKVNPEVRKLSEERNSLREEVQQLHLKVQKAQQAKARARKKRIEQEGGTGDKQKKLGAQNQIDRALTAKRNAIDVQANKFAKGTYNRAENELKSAQSLMQSDSFGQAEQTAKSAKSLFEKAASEAKPKYDEAKKKQEPMKRLASLTEKLEYNFGEQQVESVGRGVRVIIPELFAQGGETIAGGKRGDLRTLAELAKKFDEFDIAVDGYTRKGDATENLTISQVRAQEVKNFLKDQGIDGNRIDSDGHGQSNIRYPNTPSKNDRVEITFRISG